MSRGIGEFEPIQEHVPEWLAVIIALLTQLGDVWFLSLLLVTLYWAHTSNRDDIAVVAGVWLAGMGLYKGLKEIFGFPRPEQVLLDPELLPRTIQPAYEATAFATGYGFPSGHAVNATIVYFGLASVLAYGTRRRRFLAAGTLVATVSFSRVALGVHYLVDVVVGAAVGIALLLLATTLMKRAPADKPTVTFALAIVTGLFFVVASDAYRDSIFVLAASLGAFAGWQLIVLGRQVRALDRPSRAPRPIAGRCSAVALTIAPLAAALELFPPFSPYAIGGLIGLVTAGFVTIPVAWYSDTVRRTAVALVFLLKVATVGVRYLLEPATWRRTIAAGRTYANRARERIRAERER
ncbi:phosphatase PAP2 family protein [Natronococcus wangiae]|uniref:phosphatase PAP2 family protein n=1 Tax=Natronococcus wangiae TaxID=3068275 RepID=UPI00273E451E|nr:phosphatase PAP2 family protein [Natronococcus sp. AD5]